MTNSTRLLSLAAALACLAPAAGAQGTTAPAKDDWMASQRPQAIQYLKVQDQRSLNVFEAPKVEGVAYHGFDIQWGAAFTQQYQTLIHSNTATPVVVAGVDRNQLIEIGNGFNNADANLFMDAQLAKGIRVAMTMYLSARHHNETWVKEGYVLIDGSPFKNEFFEGLFKDISLKIGHMEVNFGDAHFRRTDNGQAMFNPFVGNLLMDAFTTEIGAEAYYRPGNGFLAMFSATNGEVRGTVTKPTQREVAFMGKLGFDKQLSDDLRVRLTGSFFSQPSAASNTLYGGDRAGSRYYWVLENTAATESGNAWSGNVDPLMKDRLNTIMINPFVRFGGVEFFGTYEQAKGRSATETTDRTFTQTAAELIYRFGANDRYYVGGRINNAKGDYTTAPDVSVDRLQIAGGWWLTPSLQTKLEYVRQTYNGFPATDIRNGGKFSGVMLEAIVSF